ncbi:MAG: hypothetical protein UT34_C0001G0273 [candidate division WS6 bacterium GW2011_GWF2_39_15]|uniref:Uncharacterized protein n=1 Tax=candidate division WS6 bacterium GW2011_GWF2_39_15 TaxID=1619100 RepID=A0A0G0MSW5_9BACT|nr:MAG: hypothetical protein UT34_C0001G0273 [candidate division WS6 bacterium GW2011_GWF2_39_15]
MWNQTTSGRYFGEAKESGTAYGTIGIVEHRNTPILFQYSVKAMPGGRINFWGYRGFLRLTNLKTGFTAVQRAENVARVEQCPFKYWGTDPERVYSFVQSWLSVSNYLTWEKANPIFNQSEVREIAASFATSANEKEKTPTMPTCVADLFEKFDSNRPDSIRE